MKRTTRFLHFLLASAVAVSLLTIGFRAFGDSEGAPIAQNEHQLIQEGRQAFHFDTFGDEAA